MKLVQRIVFISALFLAVLYFVYTLSFSTQWALGESFGDFFVQAQVVNKAIFKLGLWTLILMGGNIIMNSHKNLRFYTLNFLFALSSAVLMIYTGIHTLTLLPPLRVAFSQINELILTLITSINFSKVSYVIFDLGNLVSYVMIVMGAVVIFMTVYKLVEKINRAKSKKMNVKETIHG